MSGWSYDVVAELYDEDMAPRAPAGDVEFYRALALRAPGAVLELGCGTGRIALPLAAAGARVVGVDRSLPMLRVLCRKRASLALEAAARLRVVCLDVRSLALRGRFGLVLCPYSALTYLADDAERAAVLHWVRALIGDAGRFALDAFVPDAALDELPEGSLLFDYRRLLPGGLTLVRSRTIRRDPQRRVNEIERRYRIEDAAGRTLRAFATREAIRPLGPDELCAELAAAGLRVLERSDDFGRAQTGPPRTVALVCAARL